MESFISKNIENHRIEFVIDNSIFPVTTMQRAAYALLDKAYFLFYSKGNHTIVQVHPKDGQLWDAEKCILEYSDELLATHLRVKIETDNKNIRDTIVMRALGSYADLPHFASLPGQPPTGQIDFDKDIDEILKEIENDPDLKIDEAEIDRILAEIQAESGTPVAKKPSIDINKIKDVKKKFSHR